MTTLIPPNHSGEAPNFELGFEGVEKRLIVRFSEAALQKCVGIRSLLDIEDKNWQSVLDFAACQILSKIQSPGECTAYLLSESSCFVYKDTVILKTCGTTTPLLALQPLLQLVLGKQIAAEIQNENLYSSYLSLVLFSHLDYVDPHKQRHPHRSWEEEEDFLFPLFPCGQVAHLEASKARIFHLFVHNNTPSHLSQKHLNLTEFLLLGIDENCTESFAGPRLSSLPTSPISPSSPILKAACPQLSAWQDSKGSLHLAQNSSSEYQRCVCINCDTENDTSCTHADWTIPPPQEGRHAIGGALTSLLTKGTTLDQFYFDPCGYSMNALCNGLLYNSHVAPEKYSSYASFETNWGFVGEERRGEERRGVERRGEERSDVSSPVSSLGKTEVEEELRRVASCATTIDAVEDQEGLLESMRTLFASFKPREVHVIQVRFSDARHSAFDAPRVDSSLKNVRRIQIDLNNISVSHTFLASKSIQHKHAGALNTSHLF